MHCLPVCLLNVMIQISEDMSWFFWSHFRHTRLSLKNTGSCGIRVRIEPTLEKTYHWQIKDWRRIWYAAAGWGAEGFEPSSTGFHQAESDSARFQQGSSLQLVITGQQTQRKSFP